MPAPIRDIPSSSVKKEQTWQEIHAEVIEGVNEISPTFAKNVKKLDSMGHILWEKLKDAKDMESLHPPRMSMSGFDVKPIIQVTYMPVRLLVVLEQFWNLSED